MKNCCRFSISQTLLGFSIVCLLLFATPKSQLARQDQTATRPETVAKDELVKLYVSVSDKNGNFISKLNYYDFEIFCDKVPQSVSYFAKQDEPAGIVFLLDMSGSMSANSLSNRFISAIPRFIEIGNKLNEFSVVTFNQQARLSLGWTTNKEKVEKILLDLVNTQPTGQTSIFDAMKLAIGQAEGSRFSKRVVVLLSDGKDSKSNVRYDKIKEDLLESKVLFYVVNVMMKPFSGDIDIQGMRLLEDLALWSGGASFLPTNKENLTGSIEQIADDLRHQYTIGFKPNCTNLQNKSHKVRVKLAQKAGSKDFAGASIQNRGNYQVVFGKE